jgi:hypothetical protein
MDKKTNSESRRDKIKLLQAIKDGRVTLDTLQESINFLVMAGLDNDGKLSISEERPNPRPTKYVTPEEYTNWFSKIQETNKTRTNPHRVTVLEFTQDEGNEPID